MAIKTLMLIALVYGVLGDVKEWPVYTFTLTREIIDGFKESLDSEAVKQMNLYFEEFLKEVKEEEAE